MDIFHYLESVKYRYHLNTVDLWNGFITEYKDGLRFLPDEAYLQQIKDVMDEEELTLVNFAIDGAHIWDPDPDKREQLYKNALTHLKAAKLLGAKTVRIDTGGYDSFTMDDEQFEHIVKRYQEYCQIAADYGFVIGPENHMGPSLVPSEMKKIAEAVNHPSYGVLLHMNRWELDEEGNGNEWLAPWAFHVHFDPKRTDLANATCEIETLKQAGYNGCWSVEHYTTTSPFNEVEWALASLKRSLSSYDG